MMAPRIGITRALSLTKPADVVPTSYANYLARVVAAGGEPVDLRPGLSPAPEVLIGGIDGLLIPGGADVNPCHYGQTPHPEVYGINDALDALELGVIRAALAQDVPVFAICRGHQVLNVACGGALLQHIEGDGHRAHDHDDRPSRFHDVQLVPGSRLHRLLGVESLRTNSRHHQAVTRDGIAPGLIATAFSPDGLIEGVESPAHQWVMGVQWHPERDEVAAPFAPLFADFVRAAAAYRARAVATVG